MRHILTMMHAYARRSVGGVNEQLYTGQSFSLDLPLLFLYKKRGCLAWTWYQSARWTTTDWSSIPSGKETHSETLGSRSGVVED